MCVCLPERVCKYVCVSVWVCWNCFEVLSMISGEKSQSRMAVTGHLVLLQPSRP